MHCALHSSREAAHSHYTALACLASRLPKCGVSACPVKISVSCTQAMVHGLRGSCGVSPCEQYCVMQASKNAWAAQVGGTGTARSRGGPRMRGSRNGDPCAAMHAQTVGMRAAGDLATNEDRTTRHERS